MRCYEGYSSQSRRPCRYGPFQTLRDNSTQTWQWTQCYCCRSEKLLLPHPVNLIVSKIWRNTFISKYISPGKTFLEIWLYRNKGARQDAWKTTRCITLKVDVQWRVVLCALLVQRDYYQFNAHSVKIKQFHLKYPSNSLRKTWETLDKLNRFQLIRLSIDSRLRHIFTKLFSAPRSGSVKFRLFQARKIMHAIILLSF